VGVITVSGGHGALAVDACSRLDLKVPELSAAVQQTLRNSFKPAARDIASVTNPVDLTGSGDDDDFVAAAEALGAAEEVDCLLVLLLPYSPGISSDLGARLGQVHRQSGKPMIAYVPHVEKYRILIEGFEMSGIPVADSIEGAVLMIEALRRCRTC
jgi:acyl-CoA synthetase (NDP forming)